MKTIITHPNFDYLSDEIINNYPNNFKKWNVSFQVFKDGWPNIFLNDVWWDVEHKEVIYIWDYSRPEYLFTNYAITRAISGYYANKMSVIIPFFPVWTMERISEKWEVATSRYFADILGHIPVWRVWKTWIHIFDLHTLEQRFFFDDFKVNPELHTAMDLIKWEISPNTVIVFPDEWAKKRFKNEFAWYEVIACSKVRVWDKREITINEWEVLGKEVLIVDDLIQSWGTIIETSKKLRELRATKVQAFATHWVFVWESVKNLTQNLDILFTTDSLPKNLGLTGDYKNLKVLWIKKLILDKIICKNI